MSRLFDQYLLFRLRAKRDPDAFTALYDRYVSAIYRFVFLKLSSKELAEDVTSETFLRAWRYVQENKEILNFRALLYQIARRLVIDTYRRSQETRELSLTTFVTSEGADPSSIEKVELADTKRGPIFMEARADLSLLLKRLSRLKDDYQDVVALRLIDGLSFSDIARILEKTPGNVRVIYHRAMKAMQQTSGISLEGDEG
jgi:RNA polymerase sigma-70 factor, ECF subfamily